MVDVLPSRLVNTTQVDTMIVQAIGLLDELDKEINTYAMRVKEWFGWHFPEMAKVRCVGGLDVIWRRVCKFRRRCRHGMAWLLLVFQ